MKYLDFKKLPETQFKRYTGISWSTFNLIVEYMKKQIPTKGRSTKLCIEDQILLCLSYWREYRTLFHVANKLWHFRFDSILNLRHVEDCLIQSNLFNLPKELPEGEGIDWMW